MSEYMTSNEKDEARYLRYIKCKTYKEIGRQLGLKPSTISRYLKSRDGGMNAKNNVSE